MSRLARFSLSLTSAALTLLAAAAPAHGAQTGLSDQPLFSASSVPANLMLALSVEYPTGQIAAYGDTSGFSRNARYEGYFDSAKCYRYQASPTPQENYFVPVGLAVSGLCSGTWSGNLLNWATMTGLDNFRQALTGGNRSIDEVGRTVLERSRAGAYPSFNIPTKSVSPATGLVPPAFLTGTNQIVYFRSVRAGQSEIVQGADRGVFFDVAVNSAFSSASTFYARVLVCDPIGRESNCEQYPGGNWKPVGLIQKNAERVRVGAAGYLLRDGISAPNGSLRAAVRDVGPTLYNGLAPRTQNPNREWEESSGIFVANPDQASATASGVTRSGAINYLNKFGYQSGYNVYDSLSEVYWTGLAHLMNVPLAAGYAAGSQAQRDGFPTMATNAVDPISYSCQGNAIALIGDNHSWCDSAVPGGSPNSNGGFGCSNHSPLAAVSGLNAGTYANAAGQLPLLEPGSGNSLSPSAALYLPAAYRNLGSQFVTVGAGNATYSLVGMAYFAHTQDIRPQNNSFRTVEKQTVDTYVIDVLADGGADGTASYPYFDPASLATRRPGPSQYWLAAKYGGFEDVNEDGIPASYRTWHTNTSNGTATVPDNWFSGREPDKIKAGLAAIFNRVSSRKTLRASGPASSTTRVLGNVDSGLFGNTTAGFAIYATSYRAGDWTGNVAGSIANVAADGSVVTVNAGTPPAPLQWSAQTRLDDLAANGGWNTARRIVTWNGSSGVPFRYASLSGAQRSALGSDTTLLDFLRGDRSKESTAFRLRRALLGDIVGSEAVLVQAAQSPAYADGTNPGYNAFRTAQASRKPVVYVGANDGMLHAFSADFSKPTAGNPLGGGGSELFAYVPSLLFNGPNGTPQVDGLAALANLGGTTAQPFSHRFYVDQTPQVADADFNRVVGNADGASGSPDWRTLLVGSLGKGGKGIYALDVTSVPAAPSANTAAAQEDLIKTKVLWEFTHADMGYYYGKPVVAKTRKYGWVVLLTSGYNNATGVGRLFIISANDGQLLETLSTGAGTPSSPSGLTRPSAYTRNFTDNTIEQVYAGDLLGNVWRFDVSAASGSYPAPQRLATLTAPGNVPQPITTAPRVEVDVDSVGAGTRRWVFVGTGQFLDLADLGDNVRQSMYALRDGTSELPACADSTAVADVCVANANTLPLTRSQLSANTDLLAGTVTADAGAGWYFDLPGQSGAGGGTERIIVDPDSQPTVGLIAWATLVPGSDPCSYAGTIYAVDFASGKSALVDRNGGRLASVSPPSMPTKVSIQQLPNGNLGLLFGSLGGPPSVQSLHGGNLSNELKRTNWREAFE